MPTSSTSNPTNRAAWIRSRFAQLEVGPAPFPVPTDDQIVVRNRAVAVNPLEWVIQGAGPFAYRWLGYPTVFGSDLAGDVVEVGRSVTRFRVGDRVLAHAVGTDRDSNRPDEGAFQQHTAVLERMASPIPDALSYVDAAVLPLGLSTAACALFEADQLALRRPTADAVRSGETVLIWGGSTSVGSNAIQLAHAAGYDVITTASPHNADYLHSLGARLVFDYRSPSVVDDITRSLAGTTFVGAVAVTNGSVAPCLDIARAATGRRFVAVLSTPVSLAEMDGSPGARRRLPGVMLRLALATALMFARCRVRGVGAKFVIGTTLKTHDLSTAIYADFLPAALADGRYAAAPPPEVVGHDLQDLQHALDVQRNGVSARKVVVSLDRPPAS